MLHVVRVSAIRRLTATCIALLVQRRGFAIQAVKSAEICHFEASSDISLYPKKINSRPNYGTRVLSCDATQIHPERDALSRTPVMCAPLITGGVPVAPTGCAQRSVCPLESIQYRRCRRAPTVRSSLDTAKSASTTLRQRFYSVFTSITR